VREGEKKRIRRPAGDRGLREKSVLLLKRYRSMERALEGQGYLRGDNCMVDCSARTLEEKVRRIRRGLMQLTAEERTVLLAMTTERTEGTVDVLCEQCACEKSTLYRIRRRALDKFTLALFGRV